MPNWTTSILKQKLLDEGLIADDALRVLPKWKVPLIGINQTG